MIQNNKISKYLVLLCELFLLVALVIALIKANLGDALIIFALIAFFLVDAIKALKPIYINFKRDRSISRLIAGLVLLIAAIIFHQILLIILACLVVIMSIIELSTVLSMPNDSKE